MSDFERTAVQWYPGHMTKARRDIEASLPLVDAVCEILDARIPMSSRNPDIDTLAAGKPRLVILNRVDLADPNVTARWQQWFKRGGLYVLETDAKSGRGVDKFPQALKTVLKNKIEHYESRGQTGRPLKAMILGIPNVGKSTFINKAARRKAALAGDRPGVTRGRQWITVDERIVLLDTPGILWPRFDSVEVGEALALTGAVKDEIFDRESLAAGFLSRMARTAPEVIAARYKFTPSPEKNGYEMLADAARGRGFLISCGEPDTERAANIILNEYRGGKLGRLSLEAPLEAE
ncbi:MAG: ribosome biogenesis GTPase YlqF [Oscillospiraceae bacterium]|nr:ribosome biogenesis GTPase YlqF [Oscillospiraceae bacterium]